MATTTAQAGNTPESAHSPRPLWQAPLFVLGVSALAYVWCCRPLFENNPRRLIERDLANARGALMKPDGDVSYALKLAGRASTAAKNFTEYKGPALFLVGYANLRLAEKARGDEAANLYREALLSLEQARKAGVAEEDVPRLHFGLGKAGHHVGTNPARALDDLEKALGSPDYRVEAYSLLIQGCLRLLPPAPAKVVDSPYLERAVKANEKFRSLADDFQITPEQADEARLTGGELLLRQEQWDKALHSLSLVSPKAPPAVLQRARLLRARVYYHNNKADGRWEKAANAFKEALAGPDLPPDDAATALCQMGFCYKNLAQPEEAIRAWERCLKLGRGPEQLAAALALADAWLSETGAEHDKAANALSRAASVAPSLKAWNNNLVAPDEYVSVVKHCLGALRAAGRHDLILGLIDRYAKLAEQDPRAVTPRDALLRKAEASAALAAIRKTQGKDPRAAGKARELFNSAAATREKIAALPGLSEEEKGEELFQAAVNYQRAENATAWATALLALVELKGARHERLGEAWFHLASYHAANKEMAKAEAAYRKCTEFSTPFAYRAYYQRAMIALSAGNLDDAETILVQNLSLLQFETEPVARAESLFALGSLLYRRRDYRRALRSLAEVVGRYRADPRFRDTPEMTRARFQLADSYLQMAMRQSQSLHTTRISKEGRAHYAREYRIYQEHAANEFASLDAYLTTKASQGHLTAEQRGQVPFTAARCLFNLGRYRDALVVYDRLIRQYGDTEEGLDAMGQAVACHAALKEPDKVRQRLLQIHRALPHVPEERRVLWTRWLDLATKEINRQAPPDKPM